MKSTLRFIFAVILVSAFAYVALIAKNSNTIPSAVAEDAASSSSSSSAAANPNQNQPIGVYKDLELNRGVFNDGQAAIWDLNSLDFFKYFGADARARGYRPEQPIKFSHVTHVQANRMECQYCHWSAGKAAYAAIPEVETCMGCHQLIQGTRPEQQTEIAKIKQYWDKGEPIPWQKVHVMPDHVHFNHKRHVKAGVSCQECHGIVPNMQQVERQSSMKMAGVSSAIGNEEQALIVTRAIISRRLDR